MIVVDASAVIDLVLDRPQSDRVAAEARQHDVTCAPELLLVETASALRQLARSQHVTAESADLALNRLGQMPVRLVGHRQLVRNAWGDRHFLRISDAFYVACARRLDVPLLTTDKRMARAVEDSVEVVLFA